MNGDPKTISFQVKNFGYELPGPRNSFGFELITESKVAHHLKEGEVTVCSAYVIKVVVFASRTNTLLNGAKPRRWRLLLPQEVRHKGHHSSHSEQQRRFMGYETR